MNAIRSRSTVAISERFVFRAALIVAVIAIVSGSARGQAVDCRAARAADEVTICNDAGLAKLDQDLAALRRQRNEANREAVEDNGSAFLNGRRRCGEDRSCIEQSYRNRIQELTRSLPEQDRERFARSTETQAERQPSRRDKQHRGFESPREATNPVNAPRSIKLRSA